MKINHYTDLAFRLSDRYFCHSYHAAQCLYVFTEENDVATDEVRMNSLYVNCLVGIARGDVPKSKPNAKDLLEHQTSAVKATLLRTLVCGKSWESIPTRSYIEDLTMRL